jgi:hypothetical protein
MGGGFLGALFGDRPSVPQWNTISLDQMQGQATRANQAAMPGLENLAKGFDAFNQDQLTQLMNSIMPGWSKSADQMSKNIASEVSGQIPTDVAQNIQSSDAARALTGGFGGSGLAGNLTAKDLGLTSLNLMGQGQSSMEAWSSTIDKMFAPGEFNIGSMFIDPQTEFQDTMENQQQQFSRDWLGNQVSAMPNPQAQGIYKMISGLGTGLMGGSSAVSKTGADGSTSESTGGLASILKCCFIFMESYEGSMPLFVRKSRDRYYNRLPLVARGYTRMAKWLVPLMQKSAVIRSLVWKTMVLPLTQYGGFTHRVKGYQSFRQKRIYRKIWFGIWKYLGE